MVSMKLFCVLTLCVAAVLARQGGSDVDIAPAARLFSKFQTMKEIAGRAASKVAKQDLELAAHLESIAEIAERSALDVEANEENLKSKDSLGEPETIKESTFSKRLLLRLEIANEIAARAQKFPAARLVRVNLRDIQKIAARGALDVEANEQDPKSRNFWANLQDEKPKRRMTSDLDAMAKRALKRAWLGLLTD